MMRCRADRRLAARSRPKVRRGVLLALLLSGAAWSVQESVKETAPIADIRRSLNAALMSGTAFLVEVRRIDSPKGQTDPLRVSEGTLLLLRDGDNILTRWNLTVRGIDRATNNEVESSVQEVSIDDGKDTYLYFRGYSRAARWNGAGGSKFPLELPVPKNAKDELRILAHEMLPKGCSTGLEHVNPKSNGTLVRKRLQCFADDGFPVLDVFYRDDGSESRRFEFAAFKKDAKLTRESFKLHVPDGVTIVDLKPGQSLPIGSKDKLQSPRSMD